MKARQANIKSRIGHVKLRSSYIKLNVSSWNKQNIKGSNVEGRYDALNRWCIYYWWRVCLFVSRLKFFNTSIAIDVIWICASCNNYFFIFLVIDFLFLITEKFNCPLCSGTFWIYGFLCDSMIFLTIVYGQWNLVMINALNVHRNFK